MNDIKLNIYLNNKRTSIKISKSLYDLFLELEEIQEEKAIKRIEYIITQYRKDLVLKYTNNRLLEEYILVEATNKIKKLRS